MAALPYYKSAKMKTFPFHSSSSLPQRCVPAPDSMGQSPVALSPASQQESVWVAHDRAILSCFSGCWDKPIQVESPGILNQTYLYY